MPRPEPLSFERVADEYESSRPLPPQIADRLARRVLTGAREDDWYLDAGAGTGRVGRALAARHSRTIGLDVSPAMLRHAVGLHRARADIRALPLPDARIGGILCLHVLHLLPDWRRALGELLRVLRPGGILTLGFEERRPTRVLEFFLESARQESVLPPHPGGSPAQIDAALRERGLAVRSRRPAGLRWRYPQTAAQTIEQLERRTFSLLWEMPEPAHARLVARAREFARRHLGSLEMPEWVEVQMRLIEAQRPEE